MYHRRYQFAIREVARFPHNTLQMKTGIMQKLYFFEFFMGMNSVRHPLPKEKKIVKIIKFRGANTKRTARSLLYSYVVVQRSKLI